MSLENLFSGIFKNKTVLVTGHTGFQGTWLSLWLKSLGSNVIGYALEPPTQPSLFKTLSLERDIKHIIGDLRDKEKLSSIISQNQPEIIFHLGAQALVRKSYAEPLETLETNIIGTANLLEAVRYCPSTKVVVIMTSDKCYDNTRNERPHTENDPMGGFDPYSASKASSEIVTTAYRNSFFSKITSPRIATIRAGNVIGGGDWAKDRLIPDFVRAVIRKEKIKVRNPEYTRPWQFVLEPLSGILWLAVKMIQESKYSEAWNFGPSSDSKQFTVKMMLKAISTEWGINESIMEENTNNELHEDKFLNIDSSKAEKFLGLKLVYNLQETITETVSWYKHFTEQKNEIKNFSIEQIKNYTDHAKQLNLSWT